MAPFVFVQLANIRVQALVHKDSVYLLDTRAIDGRAGSGLDKLPMKEPLSPITQVSNHRCALCAG